MLITDHAAREILGTVDRCYVIYQGQVLVAGTPDDVKKHPKVREEYLGDLDAAATTRPANIVPAPHFAGAAARTASRASTDV